jgi:hypothetical protein
MYRVVVGGGPDVGESTATTTVVDESGKKKNIALRIYTKSVGRRKKRDIIMITES